MRREIFYIETKTEILVFTLKELIVPDEDCSLCGMISDRCQYEGCNKNYWSKIRRIKEEILKGSSVKKGNILCETEDKYFYTSELRECKSDRNETK